MADYWEEYKEMIFMVPFILVAFVGSSVLGSYFPVAFWGSIIFLVVGMVGIPIAVDLQARDFSPLLAKIYGPYNYGGNNRPQFMRDGRPRIAKVGLKRYRVIQPLKAPFVNHPKFGPIKQLRYFCEYPPSVLFTSVDKVKIAFKGSYPDNNHGDEAIFYEMAPYNNHFKSEPQYEVKHATNTYAIATGQMKVSDIREAEEQIQGARA